MVEAAIVGVGTTDYFRRGQSAPRTVNDMAVEAILAALSDSGLTADDIDGFAYYAHGFDTGWFAQALGIPRIIFSATVTSGGNGSAACIGLAAAAVESRQAQVVVSVMSIQQTPDRRFGASGTMRPATAESDFEAPYGIVSPGHYFALVARRHMHEYGTTRDHLFDVVNVQREYASNRPKSLFKTALSRDEYFNSRMISDPLCLFDFTMESDGAVAVVTASVDRARDLRQPPVRILASAMGGDGRWGRGMSWIGMDDDLFTTAGTEALARELYGRAGITADDVDVALLYDHFSPSVLLQLEDFGFCGRGEGGPFVSEGHTGKNGKIPVNTHGGNLSEAYIIGLTHVVEGVEQIRGTAINQVERAEIALVTGGPSHIPVGAILLHR